MCEPPNIRSLLSARSYAAIVLAVLVAVWFGLWLVTDAATGGP